MHFSRESRQYGISEPKALLNNEESSAENAGLWARAGWSSDLHGTTSHEIPDRRLISMTKSYMEHSPVPA